MPTPDRQQEDPHADRPASSPTSKRGGLKVIVNGNLIMTIDLAAASLTDQVVVGQKTRGPSSTRTVDLVVQGTPDRPRVDVDALIVVQ